MILYNKPATTKWTREWRRRQRHDSPSTERIAFFPYAFCGCIFQSFAFSVCARTSVRDLVNRRWHDNEISSPSSSSSFVFFFFIVLFCLHSLPPKITLVFLIDINVMWWTYLVYLHFCCSCCTSLNLTWALLLCYISRSRSVWHKVHAAAMAHRSSR